MKIEGWMVSNAILELRRFLWRYGEKLPSEHIFNMVRSVLGRTSLILNESFWLGYDIGRMKEKRFLEYLHDYKIFETRISPWYE